MHWSPMPAYVLGFQRKALPSKTTQAATAAKAEVLAAVTASDVDTLKESKAPTSLSLVTCLETSSDGQLSRRGGGGRVAVGGGEGGRS